MKIVSVRKRADGWQRSFGKFISGKRLFDKDDIRLDKKFYENGEDYEFGINTYHIGSGDKEQAEETLVVLKKMVAALEQALKLAK